MALATKSRPRVGFLGVGWIGRHRMEAMLASDFIEAGAVSDPSADAVAAARALAPDAAIVDGLDAMLALDLDGIVIATPSAQHAEQSIRALRRGAAVFCQKPLGRHAGEVGAVVEAARAADRLLAVDLSYRFTAGAQAIRDLVRSGALGRIFAVHLVFHNAYGPDKPWFYDRAQAGGGCVMDLGIHLVDLAMWVLDARDVGPISSRLFAGGARPVGNAVEDYATATIALGDTAVDLACSWRLHAGQDAAVAAEFYGTDGGAALRNVGGSFFEFTAERFRGTTRERLASPPDDWGGRAGVDWARRLAAGERFAAADGKDLIQVATVIDRIYAGG